MVDKDPTYEGPEPERRLTLAETLELFSSMKVPDGALDDHLEHAYLDIDEVVTEDGTPDDILPFEDRRPSETEEPGGFA